MAEITIVSADITTLEVDAIVNAANSTLLGGGGVDGAIHRAAGPALLDECMKLGGCPTGDVRITSGYDLPAQYIIHTVGPVYHDGTEGEARFLASCYRNSLECAVKHNCNSIAFPAISCGVYGYPIQQAATIAIEEVMKFIDKDKTLESIIFACFSDEIKDALETAYKSCGDLHGKT